MARSVLVIGAGPAGMAAAIEASRRGAAVTLIDEAARPGGQIYRQADPALKGADFAEPGELSRKRRLLERFEGVRRSIDYRPETSVYAIYPNREVHISAGGRSAVARPDAVVLAAGVRELAIPFPGWTTPGVMFAGGAQAILKSQRVLPGRRVVVAGCGPLPAVVAAQLLRAGGEIRALALLHPLRRMARRPLALWHGRDVVREGLGYLGSLRRANVPMLASHVPIRAIGSERLEAVALAKVDGEGRVIAGTEREIACDLLAMNYGFAANSEIAALAGARMRRDPVAGGWLPETDEYGRSSIPWLYAAGDGAGLRGALIAECDGAIVGAAAAGEPEGSGGRRAARELEGDLRRRRNLMAFQRTVRATLALPRGLWHLVTDETIVCRCEGVRFAEIRSAIGEGRRSLNEVKRNVRTGMGWCGGRTCLHAVAALTELHSGIAPEAMMTPRPMIRPVSFAAVARQRQEEAVVR